jgi:predicted  nucleic acid-binding Zn-ribbon protein
MTFWSELRDALRRAILMEDRLERLNSEVDRSTEQLRDHERRLTRIETIIELARSRAAARFRAIAPRRGRRCDQARAADGALLTQ